MNVRLFLTAAVLAAAPIVAPVAAHAQAAGASSSTEDINSRRICRVTPTVGSRLGGTRTCRTKAEWDAADRESRDAVNRYQRTTSACMMGPNDPRLGGGPHLVCGN
jgi:hypothetical protein